MKEYVQKLCKDTDTGWENPVKQILLNKTNSGIRKCSLNENTSNGRKFY